LDSLAFSTFFGPAAGITAFATLCLTGPIILQFICLSQPEKAADSQRQEKPQLVTAGKSR
jgi:hypothetical protein